MTASLEKREGLLTFYTDRQRGKIWLEVPPAKGPRGEVASYLYQEGIVTGLGSNPVGLDRGQAGETRIISLRRVGRARAGGDAEPEVPRPHRGRRRAAGGARVLRHLRALGR